MKTLSNSLSNRRTHLILFFCLTTFSSTACSQSTLAETKTRVLANGTVVGDLTGIWRLDVGNSQPSERLNAIENAVASMGRFKQERARELLKKMTAPPNELKIIDSGIQIRLARTGFNFTVPTNGQTTTVRRGSDSLVVSAARRDGKLTVVSKTANATNTAVYELSADGQNLTQHVQIQSTKLPSSIRFKHEFTR